MTRPDTSIYNGSSSSSETPLLSRERLEQPYGKTVSEAFGRIRTPFYFYDMPLFRRTVSVLASESSRYGIRVHYAIKANTEERLLRYISSFGFGADCVSGNEVIHAASCGFLPENIVFAGVGKSDSEILSSLKSGIGTFNCESLQEIEVVDALASSIGLRARVSVRINPDIDAHTHKYVTTGLYENKFGISRHEFEPLVALLGRCGSVDLQGLHFHIGSQITDVAEVYSLECRRASEIVRWFEEQGLEIGNIDLGGGLGVDYEDPDAAPVADFSTWFRTIHDNLPLRPGQTVHVEPGRSVVAQCGTLVSRVLFVKSGETKTFLILDAGMNDLIRPALYGAYHRIENLSAITGTSGHDGQALESSSHGCPAYEEQIYDVVGPVCESSDVWGAGRLLPLSRRGDIMAIRSAGAYGQVMASRYNLRDLAPAVYSDDLMLQTV